MKPNEPLTRPSDVPGVLPGKVAVLGGVHLFTTAADGVTFVLRDGDRLLVLKKPFDPIEVVDGLTRTEVLAVGAGERVAVARQQAPGRPDPRLAGAAARAETAPAEQGG